MYIKKKLLASLFAVAAVVVIFSGAMVVSEYNKLAARWENVQSAAADVDTMLQRRADLIPNLVNTVKSYAGHETEVFDAVLAARSELTDASSIEEKADANKALDQALTQLNVVVENYPELTSNTVYIGLMDELAGSENRIAVARNTYNTVAASYNKKLVIFPENIIASLFKFEKAEYFEADDSSTDVPTVDELLN